MKFEGKINVKIWRNYEGNRKKYEGNVKKIWRKYGGNMKKCLQAGGGR